MFVGCDGGTTNVEHQRQQWWHIYVVYGPPHGRYAWFAMLAMFGASAAEVWALLISTHSHGGFGSVMFTSQALPHFLIPGILHFTWVGTGLGHHLLTGSAWWKCREHPQLFTTVLLPIFSLPHRISIRNECNRKWRSSVNGTHYNCSGIWNLMCFCFWGNMAHFRQFCFCSCAIQIAVVTFHLQLWHCICSFAICLYYSYVEFCSCANEIAAVLMK